MSDGIEIIGEDSSSSMNPNIAQEQRAVEKGWRPKDDFRGNPEDWVDAKEFLAREPLLQEVRDLKKHIRTQREQMDRDMQVITTQFSQMSEIAYKKAVTDLELQRDLAIQEQDVQTVRDLDRKIDEAAVEHAKTQAQTRPQVRQNQIQTEEMTQWRSENQWFDKDQELQDDAVTIGLGYAAKNPNRTQADMLKHVEEKIRKMHPEKFDKSQKVQVEDKETKVEGRSSTPSLGKGGKSKLSWGDLDDDERQIGRTLIKRGVLKDVAAKNKRTEQDEFLAQLSERKAN